MQFFYIVTKIALVVLIVLTFLVVGAQIWHFIDNAGEGLPGRPT